MKTLIHPNPEWFFCDKADIQLLNNPILIFRQLLEQFKQLAGFCDHPDLRIPLTVNANEGLPVDAPHTLDRADIVGALSAQIARKLGLELAFTSFLTLSPKKTCESSPQAASTAKAHRVAKQHQTTSTHNIVSHTLGGTAGSAQV